MSVNNLHPKIQALRNKVGYLPIHEFRPNRKAYDALPDDKKKVRSSDNQDDRR